MVPIIMAEGGEENPFSFKKFVEKKKKQTQSDEDDSDNDEAVQNVLPDVSHAQTRQREDRKEREENPFSFKKFLQSGSGSRPVTTGSASDGPDILARFDLAQDLPDFVQDHYHDHSVGGCDAGAADSPRFRVRNPATETAPLPDFALDSASGASDTNDARLDIQNNAIPDSSRGATGGGADIPRQEHCFVNHQRYDNVDRPDNYDLSGARPRNNFNAHGPPSLVQEVTGAGPIPDIGASVQLHHSDGDSEHEEIPEPSLPQAGSSGGLPDFLPDSVLGGPGARPKIPTSPILQNGLGPRIDPQDLHEQSNEALIQEIQTLRNQNEILRNHLASARESAEEEARKVESLQRDLDQVREKEREETSTLEDIVHHIESNLETSTERATKAEKTNSKLKQEISSLQKHIHRLEKENQHIRQGSMCPSCAGDPVREKAKYASEQLAVAAQNAEVTVKQLLAGVDQLKMVSDMLASIDKVTDYEGFPRDSSSSYPGPRGAEGGQP